MKMNHIKRLSESLILHCFKAEGLLNRLYYLKKDLSRSGNEFDFLHQDKFIQSLSKTLHSNSLAKIEPKFQDGISRLPRNLFEYLEKPFETLMDVTEFVESTSELLECCNDLSLDTSRFPDITKLYLDLMVMYSQLLIMTSRIEQRKLICALMYLSGSLNNLQISNQQFNKLWNLINETEHPLLYSYNQLESCRKTIENALILSSVGLTFLRLGLATDTWKKEGFLSTDSFVSDLFKPNEPTELINCFGYPSGIETLDLERMEKWFYFGFIHCHSLIDVKKKNFGEYKKWSLLFESSWVMSIIKDEVMWIHQDTIKFFKSIKSTKKERGTTKKITELKKMMLICFKQSPYYHTNRRFYLTNLLQHHYWLLNEKPAFLGPKYLQMIILLQICKYEINWLIRHQQNIFPMKKRDSTMTNSILALSKDFELLALIKSIQFCRNLFQTHVNQSVIPYFKQYIIFHDIPSLMTVLKSKLDKDETPKIFGIVSENLEKILNQQFIDGEFQDHLQLDGIKSLKMDLLRIQCEIINHLDKFSPPTVLTDLLDSFLTRLDILLSSESTDKSNDDILIRNAMKNVGFLNASDLSILAMNYSDTLREYFNQAGLHLSGREALSTIAIVQIHSHYNEHPMCKEYQKRNLVFNYERSADYLQKICKHLMKNFRCWVEFHSSISKTLTSSNDYSIYNYVLMRQFKKSKTDSVKITQDSLDITNLKSKLKQLDNAYPKFSFVLDGIHSSLTQLSQSLSMVSSIDNGMMKLSPKEVFLQALESDFSSYFNSIIKLTGLNSNSENWPSLILMRIEDYIWCLFHLFQYFPLELGNPDGASHALRLMSMIQDESSSSIKSYLDSIYENIIAPIVNKNLLIYSETTKSFVIFEYQKEDQSHKDLVHNLNRFISNSELQALANLFGVKGIKYLVDVIYEKGIGKEFEQLKNAVSSENSLDCGSILSHGIKIGCFLALRNLLLKSVEQVGEHRMPFLQSLISKLVQDMDKMSAETEDFIINIANHIGCDPLEIKEPDLEKNLVHSEEILNCLIDAFVQVIPHSARYQSSQFVCEIKMDKNTSFINGHLNNLNCLAIAFSHCFTALYYSHKNPEQNETSFFENILNRLSQNMLNVIDKTHHHSKPKHKYPHLESTLVLLSLIVENTPSLNDDTLRKYLPLPYILQSQACGNRLNLSKHRGKILNSIEEESNFILTFE